MFNAIVSSIRISGEKKHRQYHNRLWSSIGKTKNISLKITIRITSTNNGKNVSIGYTVGTKFKIKGFQLFRCIMI